MTKKVFLSLILIFISVLACNITDNEPEPAIDPETGKSYFFLVEGKFREYDVFEIRYFGVDISDTFRYELREEVGAPFIGQEGETSHIVNRFSRLDDTQEWTLDSVWTARIGTDRAISVENNKSLVKMTFPIVTGKTWDGNLFNSDGDDQYTVLSFNEFFQVPGSLTSFQEAMVIEQHNEQDDLDGELEHPITFRDMRREAYADSVGLIFKEYNVVQICSVQECLGQGFIQSGRFYRETLTAHGKLEEEGG